MIRLPATAGVAAGLSVASVPSQRKRASTPAGPLARPTEFDAPEFLARLRCGEAQAYRVLIRRFHGTLVRFATSIIGSRAQAEEVAQDAWLAVFSGIGAFKGRSSLVAWVFRIVLNRARTRITRERRLVGLPALVERTNPDGTIGDLSESQPDGQWSEASRLWDEISPERICDGRQLWSHVMEAIDRLPSGQRAVITIWRDTEGCEAADACKLRGIAAGTRRDRPHLCGERQWAGREARHVATPQLQRGECGSGIMFCVGQRAPRPGKVGIKRPLAARRVDGPAQQRRRG
jgi:RNA polymerase sigma-70 factor (ECF subfamily)